MFLSLKIASNTKSSGDNIFWRFTTSFRVIGTYRCDVFCYYLSYRPHDIKDFASQIPKNSKPADIGANYIRRVGTDASNAHHFP